MTDNEIIKALECCCGDVTCDDCPIVNECSVQPTKNTLASFALSIINRQKAEIERLVEHTKEGIDLAKKIPEMVATAQAEAIKGFVERLVADLTLLAKHEDEFRQGVILGVIHTIEEKKKEMVGDDNGCTGVFGEAGKP